MYLSNNCTDLEFRVHPFCGNRADGLVQESSKDIEALKRCKKGSRKMERLYGALNLPKEDLQLPKEKEKKEKEIKDRKYVKWRRGKGVKWRRGKKGSAKNYEKEFLSGKHKFNRSKFRRRERKKRKKRTGRKGQKN